MPLVTYDFAPDKPYNMQSLTEQLYAAAVPGLAGINEVAGVGLRLIFDLPGPIPPETLGIMAGVWQAHNAATPSQQEIVVQQEQAIVTSFLSLIDDATSRLPFEDMVAIMWARRLAQFRGDNVQIDTLQQAGEYWLAEWAAAGGPAPLGELLMYALLATIQLIAMAHLIRGR